MAEIKKGDKVRITADVAALIAVFIPPESAREIAGQEGIVTRVWSGGDADVLVDGQDTDWWVRAHQIKAVKVQKPKIARPTKVKPKTAKPAKVKPVKVGLASLADAIALYPQTRKVLVHLERHGSISPLEAFGVYRITRLAARIKEIRNAGFKVETNMKTDPTGTKYAEYRLSRV
jgi:hypothetical protein